MIGGMQQLDGISGYRRAPVSAALFTAPEYRVINTINGVNMSPDGVSWAQSTPFIVDQYDKIIFYGQSSVRNNSFFFSNDGGDTFTDSLVSVSLITRGGMAYDSVNSVIHMLWVGNAVVDGIFYRRYTVSRDGSNNITGIVADGSVNLILHNSPVGSTFFTHPTLLWMNDAAYGTYGALLAVWAARSSSNNKSELCSSLCVLGASATAGGTAGNWAAPVASSTWSGQAGDEPDVLYSALATDNNNNPIDMSILRPASGAHAKDTYLFYHKGPDTSGGSWYWRRMRWNSGANNWSTGLTTETLISSSNIGTSSSTQKAELGSQPAHDTTNDRVWFGFPVKRTTGESWNAVYVDSSDVLSSIIEVYNTNDSADHSYAMAGDLTWDATTGYTIISYIKTTTQYAYVKAYNGTTAVGSEQPLHTIGPVDIPCLMYPAQIRYGTPDTLMAYFRDAWQTPNGKYTAHWVGLRWKPASEPAARSTFTATDYSNLHAWLRGASFSLADGDAVSTWSDESGNANHATQATAGLKPQYKKSPRPGGPENTNVYFLDTSRRMGVSWSLGTAHTILAVIFYGSGDGVLLGGAAGTYAPYIDYTNGDIYYKTPSSSFVSANGPNIQNRMGIIGIVRNGTSVSFYLNGVQIGTTQTLSSNDAQTISQINAYLDGSFPGVGRIFELAVYTRAISGSELTEIFSKLLDDYALS